MTTPANQPDLITSLRAQLDDNRGEIVLPIALGDVVVALTAIWWAVRLGSWSVVRRQLWIARETRRRGHWQPNTLGHFVVRRRLRAWAARPANDRGGHPHWRHR